MTAAAVPSATTGRGGLGAVLRWQLALVSRWRLPTLAVGCLLGPVPLAAGLRLQSGVPEDALFGRQVLDSGFALPLVVLGAAPWLLPLLAALVAGDVFAGEDRAGMWPLLLAGAGSRSRVFAGKVLAAIGMTVALVALLGAGSLLAGVLLVGRQPLISLSGTLLPPGRSLLVVLAAWAVVLPAALVFTALALLLSVVTRSGIAGVAGTVVLALGLTLLSLLQGADPARRLLPGTPLETWHGLLADPVFLGPLAQGLLLAIGCTCLLLLAAWVAFARRDETGG